jgi:hypothetical protein
LQPTWNKNIGPKKFGGKEIESMRNKGIKDIRDYFKAEANPYKINVTLIKMLKLPELAQIS